jgi:hypothetical protein
MRLAPGKKPLVTISACIPLIEVDRRECLRQPSRDAIPVCKRKQQIQPPVEVEEYLANLKLLGQAYREIFGTLSGHGAGPGRTSCGKGGESRNRGPLPWCPVERIFA